MKLVKTLRLSTLATAVGGVVLVGSIANWMVAPSPTVAQASEREAAAREVVPTQGTDFRGARPEGDFIVGNGVIEPVGREVKVAGKVPGRVAEVLVREGDRVSTGAAILRLDAALAQAELKLAEAEVRAARSQWLELRRGTRIEEVEAADAEAREARARAQLSQSLLLRGEELHRSRVIPDEELEQRRQQAAADQARVEQVEARLRQARNGSRRESLSAQEARYDAAMAQQLRAQAALEQLTVRSPIEGEILQLEYRLGEFYDPGRSEAVAIVGDTRHLHARVDVYERDLAHLRRGAKVIVKAPAYPAVDFTGRVLEVGRRMGRANVRADDPTDLQDTKILEVVVDLGPSERLVVGQRVVAYVEKQAPHDEPRAGTTKLPPEG